jgi:hypothetical protein
MTGFKIILPVWLALAVTCIAHAGETSDATTDNATGDSVVLMKMTENLNSLVEQGVATLHSLKRNFAPEPAPSTPAVAILKMDKMNSRYIEKEDEVFDRVNNLTWSRCSFGQRWVTSKGCIGAVRQITFDQATRFTSPQWRLPTRAELASLIDPTKKSIPAALTIDSVAFPDMDLNKLCYWTGTEENNSFAWAVLFVDGGIPSILYRSHRYAMRLVHTGK